MKKTILAFIFGLCMSLPLLTFVLGYQWGSKKVEIKTVYADAPVAKFILSKQIGEVAGMQSAQLPVVTAPEPNINVDGSTQLIQHYLGDRVASYNDKDLWKYIKMYRENHGLNSFVRDEDLCEFSSLRLDELIAQGKLDDHNGFKAMVEKYLKEKGFRKIAENLAQGYETATLTIEEGWDKSMAHQALLRTTELNVACASAGSGFAVLIVGKR